MTNLTPERLAERLAELRESVNRETNLEAVYWPIGGVTLRALLDAADERDRLAAAVERVEALAPFDVSDWDEDDPFMVSVADLHRALDGACQVCRMRGQHKMSCSEGGSGQLSLGAFRDSETGRFTFTGPAIALSTYTKGQEEQL